MSYSQLSASERDEIYKLSQTTELSMRAIARQLGRSQSTLSRELARNQTDEGMYFPTQAHQKMQERRRQSKTAFNNISEVCIGEIKQRLKQYRSPEQIAGRLKLEEQASISHETIYRMIYADHQGLKDSQQYLRQRRGKRRKRSGKNSQRGQIPGRVGIEHRKSDR